MSEYNPNISHHMDIATHLITNTLTTTSIKSLFQLCSSGCQMMYILIIELGAISPSPSSFWPNVSN